MPQHSTRAHATAHAAFLLLTDLPSATVPMITSMYRHTEPPAHHCRHCRACAELQTTRMSPWYASAFIQFYAIDRYGAEDEVESVVLDIRQIDTAGDENGPGGKPCIVGNGSPDDGVEFDSAYTCTCNTGFTGDTCETSARAGEQTDSSGIVVAAVLLPIVVLLFGIAAIIKYHAYQKARVSFSAFYSCMVCT